MGTIIFFDLPELYESRERWRKMKKKVDFITMKNIKNVFLIIFRVASERREGCGEKEKNLKSIVATKRPQSDIIGRWILSSSYIKTDFIQMWDFNIR